MAVPDPNQSLDDPQAMLRAYVRAFESQDAAAVVRFYGLPCCFVSPMGSIAAADSESARAIVEKMLEQARSQGYRRTEIRNLEVRPLGETLAILSGTFVRFDAADQMIAAFGFGYVTLKSEGRWKIVTAIAYPPPETR